MATVTLYAGQFTVCQSVNLSIYPILLRFAGRQWRIQLFKISKLSCLPHIFMEMISVLSVSLPQVSNGRLEQLVIMRKDPWILFRQIMT